MDFFSADKLIEPTKGDLLISEPYLPDPNFERTVVLICEHDENGTFGYVLNRKADLQVTDLVEEAEGFEAPVYVGGPVQKDSLHFIHRVAEMAEDEKEILSGVYWAGDFDDLLLRINTKQIQKQDVRFFLGYSGWSPGQLMEELEQKSWIVCKGVGQSIVFDIAPEEMWKAVLKRMGGKFKMIAGYPVDPRLN